jgi:hypothetical protein
LGKSLLEKVIARDTKRYESELKASTDAAIERLRNDLVRSVESYRVQLKKSEFFFEREYAAALDLSAIVSTVIPRPSHPDMDWEDAMQVVVDDFAKTERRLAAFLTSHGPVLTDDERELLGRIISIANQGALYCTGQQGDPAGYQTAQSLCDGLIDFERRLIKRVRDQSSL